MEGLSFSQMWLIKKMWKDRYVKLAGNLTNMVDRQTHMSAYMYIAIEHERKNFDVI